MGNQLAEERRHRTARYGEASSIGARSLAVAAGFNRAVIAGTRKTVGLSSRRHSTPWREIEGIHGD